MFIAAEVGRARSPPLARSNYARASGRERVSAVGAPHANFLKKTQDQKGSPEGRADGASAVEAESL
jgi:hypothetical protein